MPYDYSFVLEKDILKKSWNMFDYLSSNDTFQLLNKTIDTFSKIKCFTIFNFVKKLIYSKVDLRSESCFFFPSSVCYIPVINHKYCYLEYF